MAAPPKNKYNFNKNKQLNSNNTIDNRNVSNYLNNLFEEEEKEKIDTWKSKITFEILNSHKSEFPNYLSSIQKIYYIIDEIISIYEKTNNGRKLQPDKTNISATDVYEFMHMSDSEKMLFEDKLKDVEDTDSNRKQF